MVNGNGEQIEVNVCVGWPRSIGARISGTSCSGLPRGLRREDCLSHNGGQAHLSAIPQLAEWFGNNLTRKCSGEARCTLGRRQRALLVSQIVANRGSSSVPAPSPDRHRNRDRESEGDGSMTDPQRSNCVSCAHAYGVQPLPKCSLLTVGDDGRAGGN